MFEQEIKEMVAQKGSLCISIILPFHDKSSERILDIKMLKKVIDNLKELLHSENNYSSETINAVINNIDAAKENVDFMRGAKGIGIFISADKYKLIYFPFSVNEHVVIGDSYRIRDILYGIDYLDIYFLLLIHKFSLRLYKGEGKMLEEIVNDYFPKIYNESYEYSKPSQPYSTGNSLKGFENDKSVVEENRLETFLRSADKDLTKIIDSKSLLIICGIEKELASFKHITKHTQNIVAEIRGGYPDNITKLGEIVCEAIEVVKRKVFITSLNKAEEAMDKGLLAIGVQDVWKASIEGKGLELLVEKDYNITGFIAENGYDVLLKDAKTNSHKIIDVVEEIMRNVLTKGGIITFVEDNTLTNYNHIALIKRYK